MSSDALNSLMSLVLGFALAGALTSGYQALARRPAGIALLQQSAVLKALAALPLLIFAAPFIIMRNTLTAHRMQSRRTEFVMMATVLSGVWSMMCGTVVLTALRAMGMLV